MAAVKEKPHAMEGMTIAEAGAFAIRHGASLWVYEQFINRGRVQKRILKKFEGVDWRLKALASGGIILKVFDD